MPRPGMKDEQELSKEVTDVFLNAIDMIRLEHGEFENSDLVNVRFLTDPEDFKKIEGESARNPNIFPFRYEGKTVGFYIIDEGATAAIDGLAEEMYRRYLEMKEQESQNENKQRVVVVGGTNPNTITLARLNEQMKMEVMIEDHPIPDTPYESICMMKKDFLIEKKVPMSKNERRQMNKINQSHNHPFKQNSVRMNNCRKSGRGR